MQENSKIFVGLDTSKMKISVALAEEGRRGEVRFLGDIDNTSDAIRRLIRKLTGKFCELLFCYEAGPTGYGLHRQITALGHACSVIAPSLIPKLKLLTAVSVSNRLVTPSRTTASIGEPARPAEP